MITTQLATFTPEPQQLTPDTMDACRRAWALLWRGQHLLLDAERATVVLAVALHCDVDLVAARGVLRYLELLGYVRQDGRAWVVAELGAV